MQIDHVINKTIRRSAVLHRAAAVTLLGMLAGSAQAAVYTWSGGATWSGGTWNPTPYPTNNPGDIVQLTVNGVRTVDVDATIGQFQYDHTSGATLNQSPHVNTLTFDNTGGEINPVGTNNAFLGTLNTGGLTIHVPLVLAGDLDIAVMSTGAITHSSSITGTGNLYLRSTGSGKVTLRNVNHAGQIINNSTETGVVEITGQIGSDVTQIIQDSATSELSFGTDSRPDYSGTIIVKSGTISGSKNHAFGKGTIILGEAGSSADATLMVKFEDHYNDIVFAAGATGTLSIKGNGILNQGTITLNGHDLHLGTTDGGNVTLQDSVIEGQGNTIFDYTAGTKVSIRGRFNNTGQFINRSSTAVHNYQPIGSGVTHLIHEGSGDLVLEGANPDFAGEVHIKAGTLHPWNKDSLNERNIVYIYKDGTLDIEYGSGSIPVTVAGLSDGADGGGLLTNTKTYGRAMVIAGDGNYTFSGPITGGGINLTKDGTGTQVLNGDSDSTLNTKVNGGALILNGQLSAATITVNANGTLGGSGSILSATVNGGGVLSPGNSPGTLTVTGNLNVKNGATVFFEGGDLISVGGTLDLDNDWTLVLGSGFQDGGSVVLFQYGELAANPDLQPTFDLSGLGFDPSSPLTLSDIGGTIVLSGISVVPEPTSLALLVCGAGLLRRRSRQAGGA